MTDRIERFGKTTRWLHWTFALSYLALAATGATLALRELLGLDPAAVARVVSIHETAAVVLLVLPALIVLSGDTAAVRADLAHVFRWSREDLRWLVLQPLAALGRAELPPAGKLNAGQKVNALATMGLALGLAATGIVLWLRPGSLAAWFVHLALFLAWVPLFAGHLFLALVNPGTRPALRGMTLGTVSRSWAAHHHGDWVRETETRSRLHAVPGGEAAPAAVPPRSAATPAAGAAVHGEG